MHFVVDARTATPHFPGIARYVRGLLSELPGLLAPTERLTVLLAPASRVPAAAGANTQHMRLPGHALAVSGLPELRRALHVLRADVVHTPYLLALPPRHTRHVCTLHDVIPLTHPRHSTWRARLFLRLAVPRLLRRADRVIAVSQATLDAARAVFPRLAWPPTTVVHHGVEGAFRPDAKAATALRRRLGLPASFTLVLGSDRPHKNLATLLRAMAGGDAGVPTLVVAGLQSQHGASAQLAHSLGLDTTRVRWLGHVADDDLPALYGAARALLLPSRAEGFGLPLLEALACGTPVVASDLPALREIGGGLPRFVPADDSAAWRMAMGEAGAGGLQLDAAACREHVSYFTWARAAAATLAVYRGF